MRHEADMLQGPTGYLGHFAQRKCLEAGHNTSWVYSPGSSVRMQMGGSDPTDSATDRVYTLGLGDTGPSSNDNSRLRIVPQGRGR